jgi:hypothetical protein
MQHQKNRINLVTKKSLKVQQSKDLSVTSIQKKKEITLWSNTRWSLKLKCVEIGSCLANANSIILAVSHMGKMNFIKKLIYLQTIRLNFAINFILLLIVHMEIDVNSCIHSMTFLSQSHLIIHKCWMKTLGYHMKELSLWKKV